MHKTTMPEKQQAFNAALQKVLVQYPQAKQCSSKVVNDTANNVWIAILDLPKKVPRHIFHNHGAREYDNIELSYIFLYSHDCDKSLFIDSVKELCRSVFLNENNSLLLIQYDKSLVLHSINKETLVIHRTLTQTGYTDMGTFTEAAFSKGKNKSFVTKTESGDLIFTSFHWEKDNPKPSIVSTILAGCNEKNIERITEVRIIKTALSELPIVIIVFNTYNKPADSYLVFAPNNALLRLRTQQSFSGEKITKIIPNMADKKHVTIKIINSAHHTMAEMIFSI